MKLENISVLAFLAIMEPEYLETPYYKEYLTTFKINTFKPVKEFIAWIAEHGWDLESRSIKETEEFLEIWKKHFKIKYYLVSPSHFTVRR